MTRSDISCVCFDPCAEGGPLHSKLKAGGRAFIRGLFLSWMFLFGVVPLAGAVTLHVGPGQRLTLPSQAALQARDGDVVEIDAGEYRGDVAIWTQSKLTIRGRGGMVKLIADGRAAESKAIWVVRGGDIRIEKIEFSGARVPDHNGAGIRFEKGFLQVSGCSFLDNENGILTAADPEAQLDIEFSEFGNNGDGSGLSHNLYVGKIGRLRVTGSYFHHARVGHLLKSRAAINDISYNRLTDESGGHASYELEFPNGGLALVMGNIVEQSSTTENATIISFGAEGMPARVNRLMLIHNTIVDRRFFAGKPLAVYGQAGEVSVQAINNLLLGTGSLKLPAGATDKGNKTGSLSQLGPDYRPLDASLWAAPVENMAEVVLPPAFMRNEFPPVMEYRHPMQVVPAAATQRIAGAVQSVK